MEHIELYYTSTVHDNAPETTQQKRHTSRENVPGISTACPVFCIRVKGVTIIRNSTLPV